MNFTQGSFKTSSKWLVLVLAVFFVIANIRLSPYAFDDAYIHIRVARNLLDLGAPYFNTDETLKVSSSSGWSLFLAIILATSRIFGLEDKFSLILSIINSLVSLGGMLIFTEIVEELLKSPLTVGRKFLFQASYLSLIMLSSIGLMETPTAILLIGIGIYHLLKSHPVGFVWLGVAVYFRIELIIAAVILILLLSYGGIFRLWRATVLAGLGMLPFLMYDLIFFQTIIPHSIIAKSVVYSITELSAFTRLIIFLFPGGLSNSELLSFSVGLIGVFSILLVIVWTTTQKLRTIPGLWVLAFSSWGFSIILAYVARRVLLFEWYTPLFTIPLFVAITLCAYRQEKSTHNFPLVVQSMLSVIYLLGLCQTFYASLFDPGVYEQFEAGARVRSYMEIGEILYDAYPNSTLLSSEIGGLGYTFQGHIADAAGLATQDALKYHPMKIPEERARGDVGSIPPEYVSAVMPELIVSYDHFAAALLSSKITEQYHMILIPAYTAQDHLYARTRTLWGNEFLRIYIRKDLPIPDELIQVESN